MVRKRPKPEAVLLVSCLDEPMEHGARDGGEGTYYPFTPNRLRVASLPPKVMMRYVRIDFSIADCFSPSQLHKSYPLAKREYSK